MDIHNIPQLFGLPEASQLTELNKGHINRTFLAICGGEKYILQSLNRDVFYAPEAVMDNISRIEAAFAAENDIAVPHFIACGDKNYAVADGELWRIYRYIAATAEAAADAAAAGRHFGEFIRIMDGTALNKTPAIDGFHDFGRYFAELTALGGTVPDTMRRLDALRVKLGQIFTDKLNKRVIHGDAKPDNIISGSPACIIDLDTVMYGYAAIDYGDLVRSVCRGTSADLSAVRDITKGFSQGLKGILGKDETDSLYYGILCLTGELAVRYLSDSKRENKYFRGKTSADCIARAEELLVQLEMFSSHETEIKEIIYEYFE
ncbi:aminoglycoside phosphotransferase family protein [Ruminococcus sp.]|uniref:phosphotransferase enzyme family protein n=1 Tax=Ruminococcus sp. TaxID=41978 RepID=UPI0025FEE0A2|nr:aminoglycoside phosphotransferase family protein [Ruminococcus sp.]MCR4638925.1 aminoglycoside phosphotransferase family protein [Ruminococcus sp.]